MEKDTHDSDALLPALADQTLAPKAPQNFAPEAIKQVEQEVETQMTTIAQALNTREFLTTLENLGRSEQTEAGVKIELIETRVNRITKVENTDGNDIPAAVNDMRQAIDQLNPQRAKQHVVGRMLERIPFGQVLLEAWWASGLRQITMRRETIREQIKGIRNGLVGNQTLLLSDKQQLNQLYDFISQNALAKLQRTAYFGELLFDKLQAMHNGLAPDDPKRDHVRRAMEIVAVRVRNMRLIEQALQQGLVTIDITNDGNEKIAQSLEETATLTTSYLTVAMALYQALAHQKQAIHALVKARQGTTDVMLDTSRLAKESVDEVSKQYFNPAEELQKVEQAQQNLMSALQSLEDASRTGFIQARQGALKLRSMTEELRAKQAELRGANRLTETSAQ